MRLKSHVRLIGLVALAGLAIGLILLLRAELGPLGTARAVATQVELQAALADLVHELQRERGLTMIRLAAGPAAAADGLAAQQARTDASAARAAALGVLRPGELAGVAAERQRIGTAAASAAQAHARYTGIIGGLLQRFAGGAQQIGLAELRAPLVAHLALLRAKEQLARLRALVAGALAGGSFEEAELHAALQQVAVFDAAVAWYLQETDAVHAARMRAALESAALRALRDWLVDLAAPAAVRRVQPGLAAASAWFEVASAAGEELQAVGAASIASARERAAAVVADAEAGLAWRIALLVIGWAVSCWLVFLSLRRLLGAIRQLTRDTQALLGRLEGTDAAGEGGARDLPAGFMQLIERVDQLSEQASTDPLTGLLNRYGLTQLFRAERLRASRHGRALALVMLDLDHFKRVNDDFGHAAGDNVLRALAGLLRHAVRGEDIVARWGGEEFVIIAPESDEAAAAALAEKLRHAIAAHDFGLPQRVTASFGVTELAEGDDLERLVARADAALYLAKTSGRNRVSCSKKGTVPFLSEKRGQSPFSGFAGSPG